MQTDTLSEISESWIAVDIFKLMWKTVKNNIAGIIAVFVFYGIIFTVINIARVQTVSVATALLCQLLIAVIPLSLISVLRPVFESGHLKLKAVFPSLGFIGKVVLLIVLLLLFYFLSGIFFSVVAVFFGSVLKSTFGRLFTQNAVSLIIILGIFISLLLSVYFSFCMISFSGKKGFSESLAGSLKIFTENKFLTFCVFGIITAAIILFLVSYLQLSFPFSRINHANMDKLADIQKFLTTKFLIIQSVLMPLYWFLIMSVYFTLGHEGEIKEVIEARQHFGRDYCAESDIAGDDNESAQNGDDAQYEAFGFSLSHAFYFSWGIYKKFFLSFTAGTAGTYAVFLALCFFAASALKHTGVIAQFFPLKALPVQDIFFLTIAASVIYYFLMFFYFSFAGSFFRGKGIRFKNFFPSFKTTFRFISFFVFIAAFLLAIPFIIEKLNLILRIAVESFNFNGSYVSAAGPVLFAVMAVYVLVSFFYVPFFILDGHSFSDSLARCTEMMRGQKMAFFCALTVLLVINLIGHALVAGWLFTVPFSVLVLVQIYVTISPGYSKYKEDVED